MNEAIEKKVFWLEEFTAAYGPKRTTIYKEIRKGRLKAFKIGLRTAITRESAQDWLTLCQSESTGLKKVSGDK